MKNGLLRFFSGVLLAILPLVLCSQTVQVTVNIPPPYPVHLEDYINLSNQTIITLQNTGNQARQIKLRTRITGDNGISAQSSETFTPSAPILLNPLETKVITGGQLQMLNGNFSQNDLEVSGVNVDAIIQTEVLPEGAYSICVDALDYVTGDLLSNLDFSCAQILITHFDPPEIITPFFEQEVIATVPQLVNMAWTPAGVPGFTRYRIELVDMDQNGLFNINDAFFSPGVQTLYQEANLLIPQLTYDLIKPPLVVGHQYALRVTAYDPSGTIHFKNNGFSPISNFTYQPLPGLVIEDSIDEILAEPPVTEMDIVLDGGSLTLPPGPDPQTISLNCVADCAIPQPPGPALGSIPNQSTIRVGLFEMQVNQVTGPNSGSGKIYIDFLNTEVEVQFSGISVNSNLELLSGKVTAKVEPGSLIDQATAMNENANLQALTNQVENLLSEVQNNTKRVSLFNGNQGAKKLPLSLDQNDFDLVIAGLIFTPTAAYLNTVLGIETLPNANNPYVGLGKSGFLIQPEGFCSNQDLTVDVLQDIPVSLVQNGGDDWIRVTVFGAPNSQKTHAVISCTGVEEIHLDAALEFGRDYLLPVDNQGQELPGEVSVDIQTVLSENLSNWMLESPGLSPSPHFTLPALPGFVLTPKDLVYDQHRTDQSPNMSLPNGHPLEGEEAFWQGLSIGSVDIQFPEGFEKNGQSLTVSGGHILLDHTGLWGDLAFQNVLDAQNGSLGSWAFSVESFFLDMQESKLAGGGFAGAIELPLSTVGVDYEIALSEDQNGDAYTFGINPGTDLDLDMWIAQFTIGASSSIQIEKPQNSSTFVPTAELNGAIQIGWTKNSLQQGQTPSVGHFQLPQLQIEGMQIATENDKPVIADFGLPSLDNINFPQGDLFAFKINLTELGIVENLEGERGLKIGLSLGFDDTGSEEGDPLIGGATVFTFFPKLEANKFRFGKTVLNEVSVDATVGPATISGGLQIFDEDLTYGDGFRGYVQVSMPPVGLQDMNFTLQVGTAPENYRYWMVDASIKLTTGIVCGPAVAIYGFGGGFWFNMTRDGPENLKGAVAVNYNDMANVSPEDPVDMTPGGTKNGVVYTPSQGTFGFQSNVIIGLVGTSSAFNADVGMAMELSTHFGFNMIEFNGKAYLMQAMDNRGEALVTGEVTIKVETANVNPIGPVLSGHVGVQMAVETVVSVEADLNMDFLFSQEYWYVYFGSWDEQANPATYEPFNDPLRNRIDIEIPFVESKLQLNNYFMIGNSLPPSLPPLPKSVQEFFPGAVPANPAMETITASGKGFAAGAGAHLDASVNYAILYSDIVFDMGFDALVQKFEGDCGENGKPGIDGWYAKGQAYAYCNVSGGLQIDLWFYQGKADFMSFTAGALLQMQGPNPMWVNGRIKFDVSILGGLVKVNTQVVAEVGEKCDEGAGSPFDDIPIVAYVDPADGAEQVHCYTDPQIVFNFPDEPFKLEMQNAGNNEWETRGYSVKLQEVIFSYQDPETEEEMEIELSEPVYAEDGYSCLLIALDALPGVTEINYQVRAQGFEHKMLGSIITDEIIESFDPQLTVGTFWTDSLPDAILAEDIVYAIPGLGQRYYLKESQPLAKIEMHKQNCESLFKTENPDNPQEKYAYKARLTRLSTGDVEETNCLCNGKTLSYTMPPGLKNGQIYQLDIVRRSVPASPEMTSSQSEEDWRKIGDWEDQSEQFVLPGGITMNPGNEGGNGLALEGAIIQVPPENPNPNMANQWVMNPPSQTPQPPNTNLVLDAVIIDPDQGAQWQNNQVLGGANIDPQETPWVEGLGFQAPEEKVMIAMEVYDRAFVESVQTIKPNEKILFTSHFKTSKYNTKEQKAQQLTEHPQIFPANFPIPPAQFAGNGAYNHPDPYQVEVPIMLLKTEEGFDRYDLQGTLWSGVPLGQLEDYQFNTDLYHQEAPLFTFSEDYSQPWLESHPYNPNPTIPEQSIFHTPDQEDYRLGWDIYNPAQFDDPVVKYKFNTEGDLRPLIYWPDPDWQLHYPSFFEPGELDDKGRLFWDQRRFQDLAYYENLGQPSEAENALFRQPFAEGPFGVIPAKLPTPQEMNEEFVPLQWYQKNRHGAVNFNGLQVLDPEGPLTEGEIAAAKALASSNGIAIGNNVYANPNANTEKYIAVIDYSEWMAKRDHIRITNKLLYDFRNLVCLGCGNDPAKVLALQDGGWGNQGNNPWEANQPADLNNDGIPDFDPAQFPYTFYYLPLRTFLLHHKAYVGRGAVEYRFRMAGKGFLFNLPKLDTESWPNFY